MKAKAKTKLYVAVVYNEAAGVVSRREDGDYSCFVASSEDSAIRAAMRARNKWESSGDGPYAIYVGPLTSRVLRPVTYELEEL